MSWFHKDPFKKLKRNIGREKVLTSPENTILYGIDATNFSSEPAAVVMAETTDDIQTTVVFARDNGYSVTARGTGSGLSGGSVPIEGGIVISCERMKSIERIDADNGVAIVQPGVVTEKLQKEALRHNLFYPPDPSSYMISTIGGNVAENAGGLKCFKYGVTSHYVLGIEFIDYTGEIRQTGTFGSKIIEPDLTFLLVGSEGTLGVFSRIALRLISAPENTVTLAAFFADKNAVLAAVENIIDEGIIPSVMEYIDRNALNAAAKHTGSSIPAETAAMLLLEVDGSKDDVAKHTAEIEALISDFTIETETALGDDHRDSLWKLRRAISPSLIQLASGRIHEDVAVPRSKLVELSNQISAISQKRELEIAVYGHAGDGNLHVVILFDSASRAKSNAAKNAAQDVFKAALSLGGTISGEHGIGYAKRDYLPWQLSDANLHLTHQIKNHFDPDRIMNPGKILKDSRFK